MPNIMLGDRLLAKTGKVIDLKYGSEFYSNNEDPLQFGAYRCQQGQVFQAHKHIERERIQRHKTYEFFIVIRGRVDCDIYTEDKVLQRTVHLLPGTWIVCYTGCHGFTVKAEDTVFFEIKNGPFVNAMADKEKWG